MKKLIFTSLILLIVNAAFTQIYTFVGNGNWTDTVNWQNGLVPPGVLPPGAGIVINPAGSGECVLNKPQTITAGATLTIQPNKHFTITGSLFMAPVIPLYKLHGLGFSPYYDGQNADLQSQISEQQISYLLQRVALYTDWVRSYGCTHGLEKIGINAHKQNLKVAAGAWLGRDTIANQAEISNLISMGRAGEIDVAIVGSEVLLRGDLTKSRLIAYINQVKDSLPGIPVATADVHEKFLSNPDLVAAVDLLYVHIYPFWEGHHIDCAMYFIDNIYSQLQAVSQGKEIVVAETGWPSEGEPKWFAVPSPVNASTFFLHFISWAKIKQVKYFYFEAFDETWKQINEGLRGAHWGLWEKNAGSLKPGMDSVFHGVTIPDNWLLDTSAITGDTSIVFSHVPPLGSTAEEERLEGRASGVLPSGYKATVYIYINCGWWTKPDTAHPLTPLQCDGGFLCDITTGGIDEFATRIKAYLVPSAYNPPLLLGQASIPMEIEQIAVASTEELRSGTLLATLTTLQANNVTLTTATCGGNINCDGGEPITVRGVCWNTTGIPTTADSKTIDGAGAGSFASNITGLNNNTTYYARAYATNSLGTAYGNEVNFTTPFALATLTTISIANYPGTTATGGGDITSDGGAPITARGICWATATNPTIANFKTTDGTGTGSFTSTLLGLIQNTTYYVRGYATTSAGTAYGNEISFTSTQNTSFSIGQVYGGGTIFHIDGSGQHGLIAANNNQFSNILWNNGSFVTTGATSTTDGFSNTTQIINAQGNTGGYAARVCREYAGGGFTDWFLPAKDQLNILYSQKDIVGGFTGGVNYWSSTEDDAEIAWFQYFTTGGQFRYNKASPNYVCAIRTF